MLLGRRTSPEAVAVLRGHRCRPSSGVGSGTGSGAAGVGGLGADSGNLTLLLFSAPSVEH